MRLLIKQRVFAWTDTYDIYDEAENVKYHVKSDFFSLTHRLHIIDQYENEVGIIREKLMCLTPTFMLEINGQDVGRIRKDYTFFKPKYDVQCNGWQCKGNFIGWDYDVFDGDSVVAHIHKEYFHWGDTYVIDIANPADEMIALMLVLSIDAANCTERN